MSMRNAAHSRTEKGNDCLSEQESYWVIAYAMLKSLSEDLAWAKAHGMWDDSPNELKGNFSAINTNVPVAVTANDLYIQYNQESTHALMAFIKDSTRGKVEMGQTSLRRAALRLAEESLKIKNCQDAAR